MIKVAVLGPIFYFER